LPRMPRVRLQAHALQVDIDDHRHGAKPIPTNVRKSAITHEPHDCALARRIGAVVDTASFLAETDALAFDEYGEVGQDEIHLATPGPESVAPSGRVLIMGGAPPEIQENCVRLVRIAAYYA